MKKTILEIYAFAVCFFAVICFVFSFGFLVWNVVELSAPEFTIDNYNYQCHQSDDGYADCFSNAEKHTRDENPVAFPTGAELTNKRLADYAQAIHAERRQAVQGIVQKVIMLLIIIGVFLIHWRLAKRCAAEVQ